MINKLNRYIKKYRYFFVIILVIGLFTMLNFTQLIFYNQASQRENYIFSKQSKGFTINGKVEEEFSNTVYEIMREMEGSNFQISGSNFYSNLGNIQPKVIGINSKVKNIPPLIEGRFIDKDDFQNNKKVIVIGKDYKNDVVVKNGKKYIVIDYVEYEVIGIMGNNKYKTILDNVIYINYTNDLEYINFNGFIFSMENYDSSTSVKCEEFISKISSSNKKDTINIQYLPDEFNKPTVMDTIKKSSNVPFLCAIFLAFFINIINIIAHWVYEERKTIAIKRLIGISKMKIYMNIIKENVVISIIASFFNIGIFYIIKYNMIFTYFEEFFKYVTEKSIITSIIVSSIFMVLISILLSIYPIYLNSKIEIAKAIKE